MLRVIRQASVIAVLSFLSGCVRVDIPLLQPLGELHERTIEGEGKSKLLLMDITGFISEKERSGGMKEKPSMVAEVKEALQKAEKDEDIAGVILRINSPGGTVTASDLILHEPPCLQGAQEDTFVCLYHRDRHVWGVLYRDCRR